MSLIPSTPPATTLSRVPPWLRHTVSSRGEWNNCTLERSCFGPMHDPTPAVPFHHLAVRLDRAPMKMGWTADGRNLNTDLPPDYVSVIPADASVVSWWNRPVDFACLYFTPEAVRSALGEDSPLQTGWELQPALAVQAPGISSLVRALAQDTQQGLPFGRMRGEALFQQLMTLLVADGRILKSTRYKVGIGDRRVRRALEYVHAHIFHELSLELIALAAETSPFHLTRIFRQATGLPVWRYVSRLRVQLAVGLMKDPSLTLVQVASLSGFTSYSTFAATFNVEQGIAPSRFRSLRHK
jgi:AraC family transcriptional regulator